MRAIVIEQPNDVVLRDVETPTPGAGEARVRSVVAGRLPHGSRHREPALSTRVGFASRSFRATSGAESSTPSETGVTGLEPGQRVVCEGNIGCMSCPRCRAGDTHLCRDATTPSASRAAAAGASSSSSPRGSCTRCPTTCPSRRPCSSSRARASSRRSDVPGSSPQKPSGSSESARWALSPSGSPASARRPRSSPTALRDEELELALALGADATVNVGERRRRGRDAEARRRESRRGRGDGRGGRSRRALDPSRTRGRPRRHSRDRRSGSGVAPSRRPDPAPRPVGASAASATPLRRGLTWSRCSERDLVDLDPIVTHRFPLERFEDAFALMDDRRGVVARSRARARALRRRPDRLLLANHRRTSDPRVGEHVQLVGAHGRELRDDGSLVSRLEPVERVRQDRVLLARAKLDLVPDGERATAGRGRSTRGARRGRALDVEVDDAATAAKGLFLAG